MTSFLVASAALQRAWQQSAAHFRQHLHDGDEGVVLLADLETVEQLLDDAIAQANCILHTCSTHCPTPPAVPPPLAAKAKPSHRPSPPHVQLPLASKAKPSQKRSAETPVMVPSRRPRTAVEPEGARADLTPNEQALRHELLEFLHGWTKESPPTTSVACTTAAEGPSPVGVAWRSVKHTRPEARNLGLWIQKCLPTEIETFSPDGTGARVYFHFHGHLLNIPDAKSEVISVDALEEMTDFLRDHGGSYGWADFKERFPRFKKVTLEAHFDVTQIGDQAPTNRRQTPNIMGWGHYRISLREPPSSSLMSSW